VTYNFLEVKEYNMRKVNLNKKPDQVIENLSTTEFIQFAKKYNIFQESNSKYYDDMCNRIKARRDHEGLDYEIVRPE